MPITVVNTVPTTGPTLVQNGSTTFYKYEPFGYTFADGGNVLTPSGQNFLSYFSGIGTATLTFAAANGFATTSSQSGEVFTITSSGGSTFTFTIFVLAGRFQGQNAVTAYIGETLSLQYKSIPQLTIAYPSPTSPPGLSFALGPSTIVTLSGSPTTVTPATTYLLYGSNANTGYTVNELITIQVCNVRVVVAPAAPPTQTLTVGTDFTTAGLTLSNALSSTDMLTFGGSLPPGLVFSPITGVSTTIKGTPTQSSVSSFTALCTATNSAGTAFTTIPILFVYAEYVSFTNTRLSYPLYSNIQASSTIGSDITITAVTSNGSKSGIASYTSNMPITGLTLNPTTGVITGAPTGNGGIVVFTATNLNSISGQSPNFTFTVSQATFKVSNAPSAVSGIVGKAISDITFTVSTDAYFTFPSGIVTWSSTGIPNGLSAVGIYNTFTLKGIPTTPVTTTAVITVSIPNVTPLAIPIVFTITPDVFTFVPVQNAGYAFVQNIPITPIQFTATPTSGVPITFYSSSNLPAGLTISSTGLVQGTPLYSASSGTFGITATNGYTLATANYSYTTAVDTMLCYSTSGNSFALSANQLVSIPITTILRSGAAVSGLTTGYLYGLNLTPTLLSGIVGTGVYPDVVIQSNSASITIAGSNIAGSVASTVFQIVGANASTKTNSIAVDGSVYYSTDSFNTLVPANLTVQTITDFQSGTSGGNDFMIANKTTGTYYSADGGKTYTQFQNPNLTGNIYQVALVNSIWYGIATSNDGTSQLVTNTNWTPIVQSGAAAPSPRIDGGLVLRSVKMAQTFPSGASNIPISNVVSDGTTIRYNLAAATGFFTFPVSGTFSFSGFSFSGFNLECVPGIIITNTSITVSSSIPARSESRPPTSYGSVIMYDNANSLAPCRLLFGGINLVYAPPAGDTTTLILTSCSLEEVRDLSTNVSSMIIAGGGHRSNDQPSTIYKTLQYSTDYGVTWNSSTNDFSWYAKRVVWGGHINTIDGTTRSWIAIGYNNTGIPGIKYSTDGMMWNDVSIGVTMTSGTILGPLQFDGTNWNLFVNGALYTHDASTATFASPSFWKGPRSIDKVQSDSSVFLCATPSFSSSTTPTMTLQIGTTPNGPTFSSPTVTSYLGYQYIPLSTITFDTIQTGTSFFLASTLPPGLAWSPAVSNANGHVCATITGRPVTLGTSIIDVYAQNSAGISKMTITIITRLIPLKTPNTTPSGYTNFIKQKVIADSAVSSINNKALVSPVGTFLANAPQPEITAPAICCQTTAVEAAVASAASDWAAGAPARAAAAQAAAGAAKLVWAPGTVANVSTLVTGAINSRPYGVTVTSAGIFETDSGANRINFISFSGVVTPFVTSGVDFPSGIVSADGTSNIFAVCDTHHNRLCLVTYPDGVVTTLANVLPAGGNLQGVARLNDGNYAVADSGNNAIKIVTPLGVITTLATGFNYPTSVAVFPNGNIVVADTYNTRICTVTYPQGVVSVLAGSLTAGRVDGTGAAAGFGTPYGVAVIPSTGTVIVADTGNSLIRLVTTSGVVTTLAGSLNGFQDGIGTAAKFFRPFHVAYIPSSGVIVVADQTNNAVRLITPT